MSNLKIFLIVVLFSFAGKIGAQEIEWQNTIGGNFADKLIFTSQTFDGGYILAGYSESNISGDKSENSQGGWDYWVIKLDSSGNIQWQNTIGGNSADVVCQIIPTSDNGYLVGGYSLSNISGDKSENCIGSYDYWIVKIDSVGNIQWQNTIGGNDSDILSSLVQTTDGGYILGGSSWSDISGDKTENSIGYDDYWIVKVDSIGVIQWQTTIGGIDEDQLWGISQTSDEGFIVGGFSISPISADKSENPIGSYDYWIVKLDSVGSIQWDNTIGGLNNELLSSIAQTSDGGYILGGYSQSCIGGDKSENCFGGRDYWIVKVDNTGSVEWDKTLGGSEDDFLRSLLQTTDGGYLVGGNSWSGISGNKTENSLGDDFWICLLDAYGNIQWQNTIGGNSFDLLYSVSQTSDGDCILGGYSNSGISGDKSEICQGGNDYWIIKLTNSYNLIQGNEFADLNNDDIQDTGEYSIAGKRVLENNTGRFAFTDQDGFYSLVVMDSGNFQVTPDFISNYYTTSPANYGINFNSLFQIDSLNDFALQPTGIYDDLCISITPTGNFRSGMNASYRLSYFNVGTTSIPNATVIFYPDTNVIYVSASITPLNIAPDSVVFSLGSLLPLQTGQIIVTVNVNSGLPIGTLVNSAAAILPIAGDVNPGCNLAYWEVLTTGSFDPNDILVNRNFLYDTELPTEPYLEYIIRFQNTGNDTAFTVKVLNPIDTTRLQLNTLEIVNTSHPASISWIAWERNMQFQFDTILLPDSNVNEPLSHGFIRYKIKPNTNLLVGDSINSMAAIYFDFNDPVPTNTASTAIILFTGIHETDNSSAIFNIYPNPASTLLNIQFEPGLQKNSSLELYNVFGQKIQSIETIIVPGSSFIKTIDISHLAPGVYFLKAEGNSSFVKKLVKY